MTRWRTALLGEALELAYGKALPKAARSERGVVPVYGSNGIAGWHNESLLEGPSVIVGRKGSAGAVQFVEGPCYPIDTTYFVRPRAGFAFDIKFLFYLLRKLDLSRLRTATGVPGLTREDAYREMIPVPPVEDQLRIVDVLSRAEGIVRLRREAQTKAQAIIPALFLDMFGDPNTNPKGLRTATLGEVIKVKSGDFLPAAKMDPAGTIPVYGGNGINGMHSSAMFSEPKVVIGRVGAHCGNVHLTAGSSWITDNALYVSEVTPALQTLYLVYALRQAHLNRYSSQVAQPLISGSRIYPVAILIPPLGAQKQFADRVKALQSIVTQQAEALTKAEAIFQSLLARTFGLPDQRPEQAEPLESVA